RADAGRARPADLRSLSRRQVRGDRRVAGPSVVPGRSVPPGIQVEADAAASALCQLRRGGVPPQNPARAQGCNGVVRIASVRTASVHTAWDPALAGLVRLKADPTDRSSRPL